MVTAEEMMLNALGNIGCYQWMIILLVFLHRFPVIWHQILVVLIAPPVGNFTCSNPDMDKCDPDCPSHVFDHSTWEKTIIHEWDLVCKRHEYIHFVQATIMLGILFGNVIFGYLADRLGRKGPLMVAVVLQLISGTAAAFTNHVLLYTAIRFICTFATGGTMFSAFCLLMEFTAPKYRTIIGVLFTMPIHIGHALLGIVGYLCRRWDYIQLVVSLPSAVLLLYACLLPESPRWLLTMGKTEKAIVIIERAAKCNKLETETIRPTMEQYAAEHPPAKGSKGGNVIDLVRTKRMRTKTFILFINWFILSGLFYAIGQYIGQIGGNVFLNVGMGGLIQVPGNLLACYLIGAIGRKWTLITAYLICAIPMFIQCVIPQDPVWPIQMLCCISMSGSAMTFAIIYVYSGELYPTLLRSTGMGLSSMFARFGSMVAPFVMDLQFVHVKLPPLVFGICPLIAATLTLIFLPETKGHALADTVEEADQL